MSHQITHTISCDFQDCEVSETYTHLSITDCRSWQELHWPDDWVFVQRTRYFKEKYCPLHLVTVGEDGPNTTVTNNPSWKGFGL